MQIKIFSWNVNGIRAVIRKGAIQEFVNTKNPDIICLQETKASKQEMPIDFAEYEEYWNSATRPGYSGTAIFTKHKPVKVINNLPSHIADEYGISDDAYGHPNEEGRVMAAEYEKFFIVTVYTPNAKEDLSRIPLRHKKWDPAFLAYCKELEKSKPVIFCGDLNVAHTEEDLARPKENIGSKGFTYEEREGFQKFIDAGYVDTLRMFKKGNSFYTWWAAWGGARARNVGWRIDYFLVSEKLKDKVIGADIHPDVMGSDHCPVSITLSL
ncbi:MAG: exodeoxyribonuclease III [Patescibacteria group bacterium]